MKARHVITLLALLLFVLHQDFWNWHSTTMVFGFMPIGLFYHACFSVAAAALWLGAVKFAWPAETEAWADQNDGDAEGGDA